MKIKREYVTVKTEKVAEVSITFQSKEFFDFIEQALRNWRPELADLRMTSATIMELWDNHDCGDKGVASFHFKRES